MVIPPELQAQILRLLHAEKWPVGTIAKELSVHHSVVTRVLQDHGVPKPKVARPSKLDEWVPFVEETLSKYPRLAATRMRAMCEDRGLVCSDTHFRRLVARLRPAPPTEAYLRLRTPPGEQAQVDWGHFGKIEIGRAERPLLGFVIVLSYSRRVYLRFFLGQHTANFLRGHEAAFANHLAHTRRADISEFTLMGVKICASCAAFAVIWRRNGTLVSAYRHRHGPANSQRNSGDTLEWHEANEIGNRESCRLNTDPASDNDFLDAGGSAVLYYHQDAMIAKRIQESRKSFG